MGTKYVSYTRVSTKKQKVSGLGLKAQHAAIQLILKEGDEILLSFTEAESGRKDKRPELLKAIEACKQLNAILLIAKLDRLSRNASFLFILRDSGLKIVIADMPQADEFMIGIMAVIADWEGKRIRTRIREALAEKKKKGEKLGNVKNLTGRKAGQKANHEKFIERLQPFKALAFYFMKDGLTNPDIIKKIPSFYPQTTGPFLYRAVKYLRIQFEETQSLARVAVS